MTTRYPLNDLGAAALESQNRKPDPGFRVLDRPHGDCADYDFAHSTALQTAAGLS